MWIRSLCAYLGKTSRECARINAKLKKFASFRVDSRPSLCLDGYGEGTLGPCNRTVHGIALDWLATRLANQPFEFSAAHALRRCSSGVVVDLFFDHGAVNVV